MHVSPSPADPAQTAADLLALPVPYQPGQPPKAPPALDHALQGTLAREIADTRFAAKPGQTLLLHTQGKIPARRLVLIGTDPSPAERSLAIRRYAGQAARCAVAHGASTLAIVVPVYPASDPLPAVQATVEGLLLGAYRFDKYLTAADSIFPVISDVQLLAGADLASLPAAASAVARGRTTAEAVARARDLVNEPAGELTPARLAEIAENVARQRNITATILGPDECRRLGMGLLLAVAQGSAAQPRLIHLAWAPKNAKKRVVLVGKGITFDSGGLSLKPGPSMLDMKTDMAGAAAVLSALVAAADEDLAVEIHAIAPCAENMPSDRAYKLGDVLRSKAGKTVEVTNTDAEGRLLLADALSYGLDLRPDAILDFATLTGACVVALGPHLAGVMANNERLLADWLAAANAAGEPMWHLPLPQSLREQLKSEIADMKNSGERWGAALTAGLFLQNFVGDTPWLHVDIAGPASADKEDGHLAKGATGFAVSSILEYLRAISRQ